MSWCIVALLVTSAVSAVTSQHAGVQPVLDPHSGEAMINSMISGETVPSSNILNVIGSGDTGSPAHTGMTGQVGPMKKFQLEQVQGMIIGMNNGYRYKYDGTVSNNAADAVISMNQLITMRDQLQVKGAVSGTKQFTMDEIRMMIDGMNHGLFYNREGHVTTRESGESLYTIGELRGLLSEQEALEQVLNRFILEDVQRLVRGMESGLKYNYQGAVATEGQKLLPLNLLRDRLRLLEAQGGKVPTGMPTLPGTGVGGPDLGIQKTADFELADLERMKKGIANGLAYNYQGQLAMEGQARLTTQRIDELLAKLKAKGPMGGGVQSTNFTLVDVDRMLKGMGQGSSYNYQGLVALGNEQTLTRQYLERLKEQLTPGKGMGGMITTPSFQLEDINRMLTGMDNGFTYNYQGLEWRQGDQPLTRIQLNQLKDELTRKDMGGAVTTPSFQLADINRMLTGMDNGFTYNDQGLEWRQGDQLLTRIQLNQVKDELLRKGMGSAVTTPSFQLADINRMLTGMDSGFTYNDQGLEWRQGDQLLTRIQLNQLKDELTRKGMDGKLTTPSFSLTDIDRMLIGMDNGLTYNYQGSEAAFGEKPLERAQLIQFKNELANKGMGGELGTASFMMDDIFRMLAGMDGGLRYNYQGIETKGNEKTLTRGQLERMMSDLKNQGPRETSQFSVSDLERMAEGMKKGQNFNYSGLPAAVGEPTLSKVDLDRLLSQLTSSAGIKGSIDSSSSSTSTNESSSGQITGVGEGGNMFEANFSSETSQTGSSSETVITIVPDGGTGSNVIDLNPVVKGLEGAMTHPFSAQEIRKLMDGIRQGFIYNKKGAIAKEGEEPITMNELSKYLSNEKTKETGIDIPASRFNKDDIIRMKDGIRNGQTYNYEGLPPISGDKLLTLPLLDRLLEGLSVTGVGEPSIPTSRFSRQQINRMINDINSGKTYNYYGQPPTVGEKTLTVAMLNKLLGTIDGTGVGEPSIPTSRFSRQQINRMINDIYSGKTYNYYGQPPTVGEKTLTVPMLNELLGRTDGTAGQSKFTLDDINRMLAGLDKGEAYNTDGRIATAGEPNLTKEKLKQYAKEIVAKKPTTTSKKFSLDEIYRLFDGMDGGNTYNYQGLQAGPKDELLTKSHLTKPLVDNLLPNYKLQDVVNMLSGMEKGTSYNYQGHVARPGDRTWLKDQLELLLIYLLGLKYENVAANKTAEISSVYDQYWTADKGVDGDRNQNMFHDSCFHTQYERNPYFIVDLGAVYNLDALVLFNRQDCCENRADNLEISTGLESEYNMTVQGGLSEPMGSTGIMQFMQSPSARFVKIQSKTLVPSYLHLCEVEVYGTYKGEGPENIAYGKPTEMSSLYQHSNWYSGDRGVDGNLSGELQAGPDNSCFQTNREKNAYWKVDLGDVYDLNTMVLHNRLDCCTDRAHDIEILAGMTDTDLTTVYKQTGSLGPGKEITFPAGTQGRIIMIRNGGVLPEYLHLCEVEIFGNLSSAGPKNNIALGKQTEMSSLFGYNRNYRSEKGVDGDTSGKIVPGDKNTCFHTEKEIRPYWKVNLGGVYDLSQIVLHNRIDPCCTDRAHDIEILAGLMDKNLVKIYDHPGILGPLKEINLPKTTLARIVMIRIRDPRPEYLHLCEVEIFGDLVGTGPGQHRFKLEDINRMLEGLGKGEAYNTEGKLATAGEPTLNIGELKQIGRELVGATPPQGLERNFTANEIIRILDGMDSGKNYNYQGFEAGPGDTALTRDQLTRPLITSLMPNYNIQTVYRMLDGMENGTAYNYQGNVAYKGERTWRKDQLELLLIYLTALRYDNVAVNKPAEISSVYDPAWSADKGVDNNRNQNMFYDSCFHTRFEKDPSFIVDLGAIYDLDSIAVFNRKDCCENRANNLEISTGLSRNDMQFQKSIPDPIGGIELVRLPYKPSARYVQIQKKDIRPGYLHLCEVEVYGTYNREDPCSTSPCLNGGTCTNTPSPGELLCICPPEWTGSRCHISTDNIAYGKRTEMSSLFKYNNWYSSDRGVDGNSSGLLQQGPDNTCFHTEKERRPYWKVDLGAVYDLQRMVLHNRLDCCTDRAHDIEILAGLTNNDVKPVYYLPGKLRAVEEIKFPYNTEAQFVVIHIKDLKPEYLHLCEIEIYGNFVRKDRCSTNPCRNGGTCTNKAGSAICYCPPGYGGIFCMRDESQTGTTYPTVTDSPEPDWNGSRVDSAICRRANCYLPICYLPYENDCKSYVVCQRTAIGTYVAWKMRCAFGSYWGTGKTWTCERVEDLAKRGYTCPNDRCADSTLTRYTDQEIKNCRTYWYCDKGVSKPACCPPGQRFDEVSLQCVNDPQEICRKPCPLQIDGCSMTGARTMPFYDGNCRSFWNCESGHPHPVCCRSGMSYDVTKGHCKQDPTCTDHCPAEYTAKVCGKITSPGETPVQSYALADGNCRTYMKCSDKGYDDPFCCRQNYYYDVTTAKCELVMNTLDPCRSEECPRGYKEECRFTPVEGSPTKFYDTDAFVVKDCAPSTYFAPEICTCDGSSSSNECKAEVWTKFDHLDDKWSVKNYGDGWISVFGEMSKNRSKLGVTYGTFDGSSGMEVWRYDHTAFPEVTLEMTFQPVASGISKQILVSNCMSVDNGHASFEVSLDPQLSEIVFIGKSKFDSVNMKLPYNKQGWNTFKLFFDGEHVVALIEDPSGRGKTEKKFAYLRGDIVAGVGALKFGPCLDSFSMPQNNGFTGFVSEVLFSKCIDRTSRKFVRDNIIPDNRYEPGLN